MTVTPERLDELMEKVLSLIRLYRQHPTRTVRADLINHMAVLQEILRERR